LYQQHCGSDEDASEERGSGQLVSEDSHAQYRREKRLNGRNYGCSHWAKN